MKFLKLFNENIEADNFYKAALHYFNNDLNKDTALEYINNAIKIKNDPKYIELKLKIENKVCYQLFSSNEDQLEAIKELGEARFAYLSDDYNFIFHSVLVRPDSILIALYINDFIEGVRPNFNWFDVKDYFIPFMQNLLSAGFKINYVPKGRNKRGISFNYSSINKKNIFWPMSLSQIYVSLEDILEDKLEDQTINAIFVYVESAYFVP